MDRPQPISPELLSDLRNLRILNRYSGSYRLIRYFLRRWIDRDDRVRILDLATGSGDIPRLVVEFARKAGGQVEIDAVDLQASTLEIARQLSAGFPEIRYHCADIHHFGDENSYDIVLFSLALHHFSCDQAVALLRRCRSLSRGKVLVADLCRSWFAKLGVDLLKRAGMLLLVLLVLAILRDCRNGQREYRERKRRSNEVHVHAVSQHSTST